MCIFLFLKSQVIDPYIIGYILGRKTANSTKNFNVVFHTLDINDFEIPYSLRMNLVATPKYKK